MTTPAPTSATMWFEHCGCGYCERMRAERDERQRQDDELRRLEENDDTAEEIDDEEAATKDDGSDDYDLPSCIWDSGPV